MLPKFMRKLRMELNDRTPLKTQKQRAWLKAMSHLPKKRILALETGRIRNPNWKIADGNSTYFLTRLDKIEKLISIDDDSENRTGFESSQAYCESYLKTNQLKKVQFINGDSVASIQNLPADLRFDFVLLDSANDPDLILAELKAVEPFLASPLAVVVIDDVSFKGKKGEEAIPYLTAKGIEEHRVKARPNDCAYFIFTTLQAYPAS